ncbi:MAG TPA: methyl-accepting chemotaxis protein [Clostridia bacterium]|nr:methyl-accepting chemotaxis protein [Clostridia bacterium]
MNSIGRNGFFTYFRLVLVLWVPILIYFIIQSVFKSVFNNSVAYLVITLTVVTLLAPVIHFLYFKSLSGISKHLAKAEDGDIATYLKSSKNMKIKDRILFQVAMSIEKIIDGFLRMIGKMQRTSDQLNYYTDNLVKETESANTAAEQIAISIEEIARGASEQALAAQETSEGINSMAEMAEKIDNETGKGDAIIKNIVTKVEDTKNVLEGLLEHLKLSAEDSSNSVESMRNLKDKTLRITDFVNIVTDIADKTNLLALNAAIEAARSGEHGRGFSVVAEEVRKLAEQSSREAEQIRNIAFEIQAEANKAAEIITGSQNKARENISRGESSRVYFDEMVNGINELDGSMDSIKSLSIRQVSNVRSVLDAAEKMAAVSEETAAGAQEVAASSQQQMESFKDMRDNAKTLYNISNDLHNISTALINKYQIPEEVKAHIEKAKAELIKLSKEGFVIKNNIEMERKAFKELADKIGFTFVGTRDMNGECIYITTEKKVETVVYRPWFQEASKGKTNVSVPFVGTQTNSLGVNIAVPIKDERDQVIGVISAGMEI